LRIIQSYILGASFLNHVGQFDAALPLLEKAHELTPNKQSPLFELITNQLSRGKNDEAVVTAKQALDLDPLFEDAQRLYMVSLLYAGKNADFEVFFTKNLPTNLNQQLISIMIDKKQSRLLPLMLENLVKRTPKDQQLRVSLAAVYMMNGQVSLAIKSLEQAVKDLPEFAIQGNQLISDLKSGKNPFLK
jgi:tetratricopeptide (TPR) repeat protein